MNFSFVFGPILLGCIAARWAVEAWLRWLNRRHVMAHAKTVPEAFRGTIDEATYAKSVQYTLAKNRLSQFESVYGLTVLLVVLLSGVLPRAFYAWKLGDSAWSMAAFLCLTVVFLSFPDLPLQWHEQFRLEERFGFNTTTQKLWWLDRLKGLALGLALGYPLLVLVLKLFEWTGQWWWLWAWACLLTFQLCMVVLAPILIMPLFNKFTPLPVGTLRERLLDLAQRTGFSAREIEVMDGSKRSRHSNAFFTGLGRFRKIVLFDTLIQQLSEPELEAVLAHEIGHYKRGHIPKMLLGSAAGLLLGFFALAEVARQDWFYRAFGFAPGNVAPALLLFGLLAGTFTFWLSPLAHYWSRRYEYQADAYAAQATGQPTHLIGALRKLTEKNLSNLTPHPFFSAFYYSHPTVLERERKLTLATKAEAA